MTTVSGISSSSISGYKAPATGAGGSVGAQANVAGATQPAVNQPAVESVLTTLGNNASYPLTYNAAGLLGSRQQVSPSAAGATKISMQAAKDAVVAAENVVTDTLGSLLSNSSSGSTNSSFSAMPALQGSPGRSNVNVLMAGSDGQTAQNMFITVQNGITNTLNSLGADSSPGSSGTGK